MILIKMAAGRMATISSANFSGMSKSKRIRYDANQEQLRKNTSMPRRIKKLRLKRGFFSSRLRNPDIFIVLYDLPVGSSAPVWNHGVLSKSRRAVPLYQQESLSFYGSGISPRFYRGWKTLLPNKTQLIGKITWFYPFGKIKNVSLAADWLKHILKNIWWVNLFRAMDRFFLPVPS